MYKFVDHLVDVRSNGLILYSRRFVPDWLYRLDTVVVKTDCKVAVSIWGPSGYANAQNGTLREDSLSGLIPYFAIKTVKALICALVPLEAKPKTILRTYRQQC
jgi:hypothetical protein